MTKDNINQSSDFINSIKVANWITSIAGGFLFMIGIIVFIILKINFDYFFYMLGVGVSLIYISTIIFAYKKKARVVPMTDQDKIDCGIMRSIGEIQRSIGIEGNCSQCNKPILKDSVCVMQYDGIGKYWNHFQCEPNRKKMIKQYYSEEKRRAYPELNLLKGFVNDQ